MRANWGLEAQHCTDGCYEQLRRFYSVGGSFYTATAVAASCSGQWMGCTRRRITQRQNCYRDNFSRKLKGICLAGLCVDECVVMNAAWGIDEARVTIARVPVGWDNSCCLQHSASAHSLACITSRLEMRSIVSKLLYGWIEGGVTACGADKLTHRPPTD